MNCRISFTVCGLAATLIASWAWSDESTTSEKTTGVIRAGAAAVDVTPETLPVLVNGGFLERTVNRVDDRLFARTLVLEDGSERIAIVVVDSCMIPLDVCDHSKRLIEASTGIRQDRILISATHTHSAPSVMNYCLGSRADKTYTQFLPKKIEESVVKAIQRLQPAKLGAFAIDASHFTKCRRWITRSDKPLLDPFAEKTVRAMMHPGHLNPNYTTPAGPIDPWLTILKVESLDGAPISVFANFSMHYFEGHAGLSADYFGRTVNYLEEKIGANRDNFVAIFSQGTSGDLWWGDYSLPADQKPFKNIDHYSKGLSELAISAWNNAKQIASPNLKMAEKRMTLQRRVPSAERLAWAERKLKLMPDDRPRDRPEVYAQQAVYLHENPQEEIVLQAIRIGDFGVTAIPNEVYALTGLKLKLQSPLKTIANVSLANGASGYIPPTEQHALGGYNSWPARTAGLEVAAEAKIVDSLLNLLETVAGKPRNDYQEPKNVLSEAIAKSKPIGYWRLGDLSGPMARNQGTLEKQLHCEGLVAYHLPGTDRVANVTKYGSRAIQLAGGRLVADQIPLNESYTIEFSFFIATPIDFRDQTATLFQQNTDELIITGRASKTPGRLAIAGSIGETDLVPHRWNHLVLVRNGDFIQVFLNGKTEISTKLEHGATETTQLYFGGSSNNRFNFEGRLDELCVFNRALDIDEISAHFAAAGFESDLTVKATDLRSDPLSPEESLRKIHVREGYRVELVAAEPLIRDPVAIDWGTDGRLWVVEMADYPMGMDNKGKPGGRVRWLEDTDGDGTYDRSTLFMDNIGFPNGIMAWKKGVLVTAAPEIFYAEDTNGDGKADKKETLFEGFIEGNQQLRVNGLRWGLDNWIHCASGGHHAGFGSKTSIRSLRANASIDLGSRDMRFRPEDGRFEAESGPSQYGKVRDDWGNWFGVQNSMPLWHYVLQDRYLKRNPHAASPDPRKQIRVPRMPRVYSAKPPQKRFHGFDHAGHYTSACGISSYRDELLFPRGEHHAFTCEPFHNLVQHHVLRRNGTSFSGERGDDGPIDFFASQDRWCRPVMTRTGPDGALWVVDMYRYMIEHPEWLPQNGKDELLAGYRSGDQYGRIYRILPKHAKPRPINTFVQANTDELVAMLNHPNGIVRDLGHRAILQRETDSVLHEEIRQLARNAQLGEVRLQCLSVLDGLQILSRNDLEPAFQDPMPQIRRYAILLADPLGISDAELRRFAFELADDPDDSVRLQLALTLGQWSDPEAGRVLSQLAVNDASDEFTTAAIVSSATTHYSALIDTAIEFPNRIPDSLLLTLFRMGTERRNELARLVEFAVQQLDEKLSLKPMRLINYWSNSIRQQGSSFAKMQSTDDALARQIRKLMIKQAKIKQLALDEQKGLPIRIAAASFFGNDENHVAADIHDLTSLLNLKTPVELQSAAIKSLAAIPNKQVAVELTNRWTELLPRLRSEAIQAMLSRNEWRLHLAQSLEGKIVSPFDFEITQREQLLKDRDPHISSVAKREFAQYTNPQRHEVIAKNMSAVGLQSDQQRGRQLFEKHCQNCHKLNANETPIGPNLRALTNRSRVAILESILDPGRAIEPRYLGYHFGLKSGQSVFGMIVSETANSIEVANVNGKKQVIARSSIEEAHRSTHSFMPDGFETQLTQQNLADVIAFVMQLE